MIALEELGSEDQTEILKQTMQVAELSARGQLVVFEGSYGTRVVRTLEVKVNIPEPVDGLLLCQMPMVSVADGGVKVGSWHVMEFGIAFLGRGTAATPKRRRCRTLRPMRWR